MTRDPDKVRAVEERFRGLVETLPQLVWTCGADGACDYLSPQWVQYTGVVESEQLGFGWTERLHPDDRQLAVDAWTTASTSGTAFDVNFRIRRHDGIYRWFKTRAMPKTDEHGNLLGWYGSNTDIQDLFEAQATLSSLNKELELRVERAVAETKKSHRDIEKLAHQLKEAQRLANLGSWDYDVASGEVVWSDELFRSFGLDSAHDLPLSLEQQADVFEPDSWVRFSRAVAHALATGEAYRLEVQFFFPDGTPRWSLASGECKRNAKGEIVGLYGTAQDITELKLTQLQLERNSGRMRLVTAAARIGFWELDVVHGRLIWDDVMHDLYGTNPRTFSGSLQDWTERVHLEDLPGTQEAFQQSLAGGEPFEATFRIVRPDGTVKYLGGLAIVHRYADGSAERAVGVNWDLTERKEAELSLRASEHLLRDFVRHAPAAIAMLDLNLCYLQASERWLTDYGLDGQDIVGRCHYDVLPDMPERWKEIYQRVLAGAVEGCNEDSYSRVGAPREWLHWEARPWRDSQGKIGGLILFTQVITARKQLELQIRTQTKELERSNHDLEQFAYAASHDLQEPLRAVSGCASILQRQYQNQLDAHADELIQHVVDGAGRMQTLILDLLTYSRVGRLGLQHTRVQTESVLKEALLLLDGAVQESQAVVDYKFMPVVMGDSAQLRQLFQNLLGNAIKYRSSDPPEVCLSVRRISREWEFSIRDNGIGIDPKHLGRIFRLFQRLHSRTEHPGTGIGLALCEKIVNSHGGQIWVKSEPNHGSTFYFTLPVIDGESNDESQEVH